MYACLTEQADGSVAILFEDLENDWGTADTDGDGKEAYYAMSFTTYGESDLGLTFDAETTEPEGDVTITGATLVTATKNENVAALEGKDYVAYDITVKEENVTSATVVVKLNYHFAKDAKLVAVYIDGSGTIAETINGT